jgi:flagellar biosynthesis protein FlhA
VIYPDRELAINPGRVFGKLHGIETRDPGLRHGSGVDRAGLREHAQALGYTVVDASTVIATHLSHVIQTTRTNCSATRKCSSC